MNFIKKLFIAFFGLFSLTSNATSILQTTSQPEPTQSTPPKKQKEPNPKSNQSCHPYLHKVTSLDDLIRQMFQTAVFDDCLYDMQPETLQEIWGIPVITEGSYLKYSVYLADVLSPFPFFVHRDPNRKMLSIALNTQGYKQDGTLFPSGKFPDFLPEPSGSRVVDYSPIGGGWLQLSEHYQAKPDAQIKPNTTYGWVNIVNNNFIEVQTDIGEDGAVWRLVFESSQYPAYDYDKLPHAKQFKTQ
ncbi:hypothetical protein [Kingella oralis]|uniref:hypothetical protein n=1 Tax=Kingella oralis TaxID=505 RepID=UPI0034E508EB